MEWSLACFCTQLTRACVAEMSCSKLLLIEFATYICTYVLKINLLVINNVAIAIWFACVYALSSLLSPFPSHPPPVQGILIRLWSTSLKPSV